MAEESDDTEKTEDPTQKRLDDALQRGDVAKSQEVSTWFIIAGATLVLTAFSGGMGSDLTATMRGLIANSYSISMDGPALPRLFEKIGVEVIAAVAIPFLLLLLAALGGNMIQHRLIWTFESMTPKLSKISPAAGFKRLFGKQALANFAKGIVKLVLVGTVLIAMMWPERGRIMALERADPAAVLPLAQTLALKLMGAVVVIMAIVAIADYLFQYREWHSRLKMSLRELKEEFKQSEGDPVIKGKLKQVRNCAHAQAHDGERAQGGGDHHQPDPLRGRPAIRARHGGPGLRRQGRRRHRHEDPRGRRRAFDPDRREPAARPRAACHRRGRPGYPGRALQGGGRSDRLRHAAAPGGCQVAVKRAAMTQNMGWPQAGSCAGRPA